MQASDSSAICSACQHEISAGSSVKPSKAKALDCKHTLCSECFTARIRILHHDKIMVLKCPIPTCKTVTTKALPAKYCASARKFNPRRNMGSTFKTRPMPSSQEKKKKEATDVLLSQFNDIPVGFVHPTSPKNKSTMHNDIEWCIYGLKVIVTGVLVAIVAGCINDFENLFSNPLSHLNTLYSSFCLPVLVLCLFVAEFMPESVFSAHQESLRSVQIADVLLVLMLCMCTFGDVEYGATHSLGRYLYMCLSGYVLPLVALSVVVLKAVSAVCSVVMYVYKAGCAVYTRVRNSSFCVGIFGSTTPLTTSSTVYATPVRASRATTTPTSPINNATTVRTIGMQYDSRYVCAPSTMRIDSIPNTYGVYEENLLTIKDIQHSTRTNTNTNTAITTNYTHTNTIDTTPTDLSPTIQSDTSSESAQLKTKVMSMLEQGYAWDNGVDTSITNIAIDSAINTTIDNTTHSTTEPNDISVDTTHSDTPSATTTTTNTHSSEVYAMYDAIVHSIENLTTTTSSSTDVETIPTTHPIHTINATHTTPNEYDQVDTTPVEYDHNTNHTKFGTIYDTEYDSEYADKYLNDSTEYTQDIVFSPLNSIYIHPSELDLSMESDVGVVNSALDSVVYRMNRDSGVDNPQVHSGMHSPVSAADSLSYSKSSTDSTSHYNPNNTGTTNTTTNITNISNTTTNTTNPHTPISNTTQPTNTLPYTPYTIPTTTSNTMHTVDVYTNPAPLFRVPRVPSHYTDLNESPYETPVKCVSGGSIGGSSIVSIGSGSKDGGSVMYNNVHGMGSGVSAPIFTTPTKNTTNTDSTDTTNTKLLYTPLSSLRTPVHTTTTTVSTDSPDDDFKLHSNIKLKPLGTLGAPVFSSNGSSDNSSSVGGSASGVTISKRARNIYSSSVFSGTNHTTNTSSSTTNTTSTIPESYYSVYSNPVSPGKAVNTSVNGVSDSNSATPVQTYTNINTKRMKSNRPTATKTNKTTTSSTSNTNNTTDPTATTTTISNAQRWQGSLAPSLNLIR